MRVVLHHDGTSGVLDLTDRQLPAVVHWGADIGDLTAEDAALLVRAGMFPTPPNGIDDPELEQLRTWIQFYKQNRELLLGGDADGKWARARCSTVQHLGAGRSVTREGAEGEPDGGGALVRAFHNGGHGDEVRAVPSGTSSRSRARRLCPAAVPAVAD